MIILKKDEEKKRVWNLISANSGEIQDIIELHLIPSSLTNKYEIVQELIDDIQKQDIGINFEEWIFGIINEYINSGRNSEIILEKMNEILDVSKKYVLSKNINFKKFANVEKKTKTSIMFMDDDIEAVAISSTALKLFSLIGSDETMKLHENIHKKCYDILISPCLERDSTTKIFQLIRSRIYKSSITDRYMWDLIKMFISETPESYIMTVFNFLMINMLSTLSIERNPIPFIVSIIDDSLRWMMRTVYKDRILYNESYGGVDDIYGNSMSKESFYVYCCNDVVSKAAKAGMEILENEHGISEEQFTRIKDRLGGLDFMTPAIKLVTLPIASKIFEIPYKYLLTCPPKHALLVGIFLNYAGLGLLDDKFPIVSEFLLACPEDISFMSTTSSYKIRNLDYIINDNRTLFGFKSKKLKFDVMSSVCGILSASKKNLINSITGKALKKITFNSLEDDIILFYSQLYNNELDGMFSQMRTKVDAYF